MKVFARNYGIEEEFETINEIREISDEVKQESYFNKKYFNKKKEQSFDQLKYKLDLYPLNLQHQSFNCAYESLMNHKKLKERFKNPEISRLEKAITGYKIIRDYLS